VYDGCVKVDMQTDVHMDESLFDMQQKALYR
jgi:hypothetical protein